MIRIESEPWAQMVAHARETYPNECCGAMLGSTDGEQKTGARGAARCDNAFEGAQAARYELRPEDLLAADKAARERQMDLIGIYHSHPDCDAYFSQTDLTEFVPVVFVRCAIHSERRIPPRQQLAAQRRSDRSGERGVDLLTWPRF